MIESLLICLVADERKEEGGGWGVGEVDWMEEGGNEEYREG